MKPEKKVYKSEIPRDVADHLAVLESDIDKAMSAKKAALAIVKDQFSPFKVGEVCEINGYSHRGKTMRIKAVYFSDRSFGREKYEFTAKGVVIKGDGSDGVAICESISFVDIK